MNKMPCLFVIFVAVVLSVSFAVPAEDVPRTPYDESESLPYEVARPVLTLEIRTSAASQSVISRTEILVRLCSMTASDETSAEQLQSARPRLSRSITIVNCVHRC